MTLTLQKGMGTTGQFPEWNGGLGLCTTRYPHFFSYRAQKEPNSKYVLSLHKHVSSFL